VFVSVLLLRIEPTVGDPTQHRVDQDSFVLGRSSKADLVVPDRYMSRLQARFFRERGEWFLEDLGGRNPTLMNGRPLSGPTRVAPGDLVSVSDTRIRVESPDQAQAAMDDSSGTIFRAAASLIAAQEAADRRDDPDEDLRRRTNRLRLLNEFHRALSGLITVPELMELVLDRAFADLRPEEGVIFLRRPDGEYAQAATRRLPGVSAQFLYSRSLLAEVTQKGMAALVSDTAVDERFAAAQSIMLSGIRSLVAAPLLEPGGCRGMIVLGSRAHVRRFSEEDMEELVSLAATAALHLRNIALAEEAAERRVLEKELGLARQIQMALLPHELPAVPGYELCASNFPTRAVSGDLYQVQLRAEGRECVLLLADVAGKGMSASLLTASLEALAAGPIEVGLPPEEICTKVSRRLHARTSPERYATGFVGVLHTDTGRLCYANAGHNAPLLVRQSGSVEQLPATGLPLGLLPVGDYLREERALEPGDLVFIYTDGVTEATNPEGEEYGLERLTELCLRHAGMGASELVAALDREQAAFVRGVPFADDRTLIVLRRVP
jgi:serine phosphatase RsbU (regulator of sigma subunit)